MRFIYVTREQSDDGLPTAMKNFDVFLSYKSEDSATVARIKSALQARGVRVWCDQDQIRPGDHFAQALEDGLDQSKNVALIVTPRSVQSPWMKDEYYRTLSLSNERKLQLIPVLLEDTTLPGFLSTRQYVSIMNEEDFECGIDRLVWPGLTGKQIVCVAVNGRWSGFFNEAEAEGLRFVNCNDISRSEYFVDRFLAKSEQLERMVIFVDPFEGRPTRSGYVHHTVSEYLDYITKYREQTRNLANEIVFVIYAHPNAWQQIEEVRKVPNSLVHRMQRYFTIDQNLQGAELRREIRRTWIQAQKDLLIQEHD